MNHQDKIVRDPQICGGEPVFRGTRVTLRTVLASLAAGDSVENILADFPALKAEQVEAATAFAPADFFKERAGSATGAGLMKFLRTAPKAVPEPGR
jgi:uncharacterized protein (DUF433 family)